MVGGKRNAVKKREREREREKTTRHEDVSFSRTKHNGTRALAQVSRSLNQVSIPGDECKRA